MEKSASTGREVRRETYERDFKWLMGDPRGRRLMLRLLSDAGVFRTTYDPGIKDAATEMIFREGQKNLGYKIIAEMTRLCPDKYLEMLKEGVDG